MVAGFWDKLFKYGDKAKAEGDTLRLDICREIQDMLQEQYDASMAQKIDITNIGIETKDKLMAIALKIPGIKVFRDPTDNTIFYQLDGLYFDKPEGAIMQLCENKRTFNNLRSLANTINTRLSDFEGKLNVAIKKSEKIKKKHENTEGMNENE